MKIQLSAVGLLKDGPEKTLFETYKCRLTSPFALKEVVCRKSLSGTALKDAEGTLLRGTIPENATIVCLDERGDNLSSQNFAQLIKNYQDRATKTLVFCIGGADGLSEEIRSRSDKLISFGRLTWPHMLVRVMLMEQIYRAQQILSHHPYHRE